MVNCLSLQGEKKITSLEVEVKWLSWLNTLSSSKLFVSLQDQTINRNLGIESFRNYFKHSSDEWIEYFMNGFYVNQFNNLCTVCINIWLNEQVFLADFLRQQVIEVSNLE